LKEKFPIDAQVHGLVVRSGSEPAAKLKISVLSFSNRCNPDGCVSTIRVRGELSNPAGVPVWKFVASVGNTSVYDHQIDDETYNSFEKTLFDKMESDGVISKVGAR
jgi:hypothetical protein